MQNIGRVEAEHIMGCCSGPFPLGLYCALRGAPLLQQKRVRVMYGMITIRDIISKRVPLQGHVVVKEQVQKVERFSGASMLH